MSYIKRDKAIKIVESHYRVDNDLLEVIAYQISNLPPEDVQPVVHGEWIKTMEGNAFRDKCSVCEFLYPNAHGYNWCPNCGCKMDGKGAGDVPDE